MPGIDNGIATSPSVVGPITTKSYGQTIFTSTELLKTRQFGVLDTGTLVLLY